MSAQGHPPLGLGARVAYFSMEIGLESSIPTYAGGLGVLAGDTVRAAVDQEIQAAHRSCKQALLAEVERRRIRFDASALTLGFARRATAYKRSGLLLSDPERLRSIAATSGLQIAYAGKAHPKDAPGQAAIRHVVEVSRALGADVPIAYLEDYDMDLARVLCAGVDVWVNTPLKPWEASGTSGMKAALNGVPSLSVLDGWWIEGHVEGITGWSVGDSWEVEMDAAGEVEALYQKLEQIAVTFATRPEAFARVMRHAIALNGSFFNAERMIQQYGSTYRSPPGRGPEA